MWYWTDRLRATPAQGWLFNPRRGKFADPRVRQALGMALDFEWTNKNLMFSSYQRTTSIFDAARDW